MNDAQLTTICRNVASDAGYRQYVEFWSECLQEAKDCQLPFSERMARQQLQRFLRWRERVTAAKE